MKKVAVNLLKIGISAGIITYVVISAHGDPSFARLREEPKHWGLLAAAWAMAMSAVSLTIVRWYLLVRSLQLPFAVRDAFRLGFLGYLLNFISLGSVGGDLFKAVFIAREQHGRRTEAVATVIADRVVGMVSLFLIASLGILLTGLEHQVDSEAIQLICRATLMVTAVGIGFVVILLLPGVTSRAVIERVGRLPLVGQMLASLIGAAAIYRSKRVVLALTCAMSLVSHSLFTVTFYMIARGLPGKAPTLAEHFVIVPLGMVAGGLPLPLGALGTTEYVVDYLYTAISGSDLGLIVALGYRLITVVIALVGACFYVTSRREVAEVMHEAASESADTAVADNEPSGGSLAVNS